MDPAWLIVLRRWLHDGNHGLTLPFLVGVQRYQSGDARGVTARSSLREILEQARERELQHHGYFLVFWCDQRDTWVLREVRDTRPYSAELLVPPAHRHARCTLAAAMPPAPTDHDPLEYLLGVLSRDVAAPIDQEAYSRDGRQWRGINTAERSWIDDAVSSGLLPLGPSEGWVRGQAWLESTKKR